MIETERLILRPWKISDAADLYECAKDEQIGPSAGWNPHQSIEESSAILKDVLMVDETYAICLKDNKAIGSISLMLYEKEAELGYWIGREYWNQGLVSEAGAALINYAFNDLKLERIYCSYFDGNMQSKRVMEKLGFVYHHTNLDYYWKMLDKYYDIIVYVLENNNKI